MYISGNPSGANRCAAKKVGLVNQNLYTFLEKERREEKKKKHGNEPANFREPNLYAFNRRDARPFTSI